MFNRILTFLKLSNSFPTIIILDIQGQLKHVKQNTEITAENIRALIDDFVDEKITMKSLQAH